jgi:hypothetical protein
VQSDFFVKYISAFLAKKFKKIKKQKIEKNKKMKNKKYHRVALVKSITLQKKLELYDQY